MKKQQTKGYKVTDSNLKCRNYQFEIGKIFTQPGTLRICDNGFHFCESTKDCFEYYTFDPSNRVFEVIAYGDIQTEGDKSCALEIEFVRELNWHEVLVLCNSGKDNTGRNNSGDSNSGDSNSGYRNSGNWNSGNWNSGNWNSGYRNSGNWNSGNWNSGNWNSGDSNSGYRNSGNWNSGDRNSGDSNSGYRNSGAFCTNSNPMLILFDKESSITVRDWENHPACNLMYKVDPNMWIYSSEMTEEEKVKFPTHETTGGYLKRIPIKEAWLNMWGNLSEENKNIFTSLENFDADKFFEITGIKV